MVDMKIEVTDELQEMVQDMVEQAKQDALSERKKGLIHASGEGDSTIVEAGSAYDPGYVDLVDYLKERDDIPNNAQIQEVHIEVEQPTTVRFSIPDNDERR